MDRNSQPTPFWITAGGLACFFIGLGFGYWFWKRAHTGGNMALGAMPPFVLGPGFTAPAAELTFVANAPRAARVAAAPSRKAPMSHDTTRRPDVDRGFYVESIAVASTAVEILPRSAAGARRVRIATDQPIRIGNGSGIAADPSRGMPIMPGEQPFDLGVIPAASRLFAVVPLGGVAANVSLSTQLVED